MQVIDANKSFKIDETDKADKVNEVDETDEAKIKRL